LKFFLSTYFFYNEWRQRTHVPVDPIEFHKEYDISAVELGSRADGDSSDESFEEYYDEKRYIAPRTFDMKSFYASVVDEISPETRYGFFSLALFYVFMNNLVCNPVILGLSASHSRRQIFVLFLLADPGTIQLIKSGTTLITAIVMIATLGAEITGGQWIAIVLQVCGIVVTQYGPNGSSTYPLSTYTALLFHTTLSSVSSVYNQSLCKREGSLHVMNMSLYSAGFVINCILHWMVRFMNSEEPGFFSGYGNWGACMVIISNVFIGLAMTAVYKCSSLR
jgi:hypothetical protein